MLPGAGLTEKLATGFHRNTLRNTEGGTDQEEFRLKAVVDRLNTTGSIWLGFDRRLCGMPRTNTTRSRSASFTR